MAVENNIGECLSSNIGFQSGIDAWNRSNFYGNHVDGRVFFFIEEVRIKQVVFLRNKNSKS